MTAKAREPRADPGRGARQKQQFYLLQFSYTAAAWAAMLKSPSERNRVKAVETIVKSLGGCFPKIVFECDDGGWEVKEKFVPLGDQDVVTIVAFPDDEAAAAFAMLVSAGGAVKSFKTTRILPWSQAMSAMAKAGAIKGYHPPGGPRGTSSSGG